jgi:putative ABC transport system permease protein
VGKVVKSELLGRDYGNTNINIIGVVGDSRFRSVRKPIDPIMFRKIKTGPNFLMVRYRGDPETVRGALENQWKQFTNEVPFNAKFSEDIMAEMYKKEDARAKIFAAFSLLAVIIGCLGLFGLASFTAERRTKEIGIRKVLGAQVSGIVALLSRDFTMLVGIAALIAFPVAWWAMYKWLETFAYRTEISWWIFLVAGAVALVIALLTVSIQTVRAALANPVESLRSE